MSQYIFDHFRLVVRDIFELIYSWFLWSGNEQYIWVSYIFGHFWDGSEWYTQVDVFLVTFWAGSEWYIQVDIVWSLFELTVSDIYNYINISVTFELIYIWNTICPMLKMASSDGLSLDTLGPVLGTDLIEIFCLLESGVYML